MTETYYAIAGWFAGISTEIKAVLLTLVVTIIWNEYREWQRNRVDRRQLASMILAEVLNQAAFVIHLGGIVNFALGKGAWMPSSDMSRYMPPSPHVFMSMVDRLPILGAALAANVVAYNDNIDRARTFVGLLPQDVSADELARVRFSEVALAMRFAAEIGQVIIPQLRAASAPIKSAMHETIVTRLLSSLEAVRSGGSPTVDPNARQAA
jgi:hypothetical protein